MNSWCVNQMLKRLGPTAHRLQEPLPLCPNPAKVLLQIQQRLLSSPLLNPTVLAMAKKALTVYFYREPYLDTSSLTSFFDLPTPHCIAPKPTYTTFIAICPDAHRLVRRCVGVQTSLHSRRILSGCLCKSVAARTAGGPCCVSLSQCVRKSSVGQSIAC